MSKLYWHKESHSINDEPEGSTVGDFMKKYNQPDWCGYPSALEGFMGCMSLVHGYIKKECDCDNCPEKK